MRAGICGIVQLSRKDFHGFWPALISAYYGKPGLWSGFSRFSPPGKYYSGDPPGSCSSGSANTL